jgi:hypothetical protein
MDWNIVLGTVGVILGVVGLIYAMYITRKSKREKQLAYEVLSPVPIADVVSRESEYSLKIVYERPGEAPKTIDHAALQYLRFTNFGRAPIRKDDLTQDDPLRVVVKGGNVLDISIASVTRAVCGISLANLQQEMNGAYAHIDLAFLDYQDGALVQIVTDSIESAASLEGTIVGMPEGIFQTKEVDRTNVSGRGCIIPAVLQILAIAAVPLLYRRWAGTWENALLLLLPVGALVLPLAITLLGTFLISPLRGIRFPEPLAVPGWYHDRLSIYEYPPSARRRRLSEIDKKSKGDA